MNRKELIRLAVLGEISDDYEEPVHIHRYVAEALGICGVAATPEDIRRSLIDLIELGLAKAYWLWGPGHDAEAIHGLPAPDLFQKYYFYTTEEGLRTLTVWRREWPLDDEGELLPGWSPPTN